MLKLLFAPLIAMMTIVTALRGLVVVLLSKALAVISFAFVVFAVPIFICGMDKSGCLLLILAWLISTLGLPRIADWLWRGLDNP